MEANISGIYLISNSIDHRIYIGSAFNVRHRINMHKYQLLHNKHHSKHLQRFVNKYGLSSIEFSIIEKCSKEIILIREQHYLDLFKPDFNTCLVAGNTKGVKNTPEQKIKISERLKGAKNPFYGKKHSEETKLKMRADWHKRHKPKPHTLETKKKLSLTKLGSKNPNAKPVVQYLNGVMIHFYLSAADAARSLGVCPSAIKNTLNKENRKCKGYVFKSL